MQTVPLLSTWSALSAHRTCLRQDLGVVSLCLVSSRDTQEGSGQAMRDESGLVPHCPCMGIWMETNV